MNRIFSAYRLSFLLTMILISGCSTMYFHNSGLSYEKELPTKLWHNDGVLRLVEFSKPLNLADACNNNDWETVKIRQTFVQALISNVDLGMYDPWELSYSCGKKSLVELRTKRSH